MVGAADKRTDVVTSAVADLLWPRVDQDQDVARVSESGVRIQELAQQVEFLLTTRAACGHGGIEACADGQFNMFVVSNSSCHVATEGDGNNSSC